MKNVNEFRNQVNLYFDKALEPKEEAKVLTEKETNPELSKVFHREQCFRDLIKNGFQRTHVSPELIQNIKDKIRVY